MILLPVFMQLNTSMYFISKKNQILRGVAYVNILFLLFLWGFTDFSSGIWSIYIQKDSKSSVFLGNIIFKLFSFNKRNDICFQQIFEYTDRQKFLFSPSAFTIKFAPDHRTCPIQQSSNNSSGLLHSYLVYLVRSRYPLSFVFFHYSTSFFSL